MHIKSNIEHNIVDVIILAICPLILVLTDVKSAFTYCVLTSICLLISSFVCYVLNKILSKTLKIFVTIIISTMIVTIVNFVLTEYQVWNFTASNLNYYAILSTIVMSIDLFYIDSKAVVNHYLFRVISSILVFLLITMFYGVIKEFLCIGTIVDWKPFKYSGFAFFKTITFSFILMGFTCVFFEVIFRTISKYVENKSMIYAKLLKQIKNERVFQYDSLRRQKLLESNVEYKYINTEEYEDIIDRNNKNESLAGMMPEDENQNIEVKQTVIKKKKSKLKVSKEAKIQQLFDKNRKGGAV